MTFGAPWGHLGGPLGTCRPWGNRSSFARHRRWWPRCSWPRSVPRGSRLHGTRCRQWMRKDQNWSLNISLNIDIITHVYIYICIFTYMYITYKSYKYELEDAGDWIPWPWLFPTSARFCTPWPVLSPRWQLRGPPSPGDRSRQVVVCHRWMGELKHFVYHIYTYIYIYTHIYIYTYIYIHHNIYNIWLYLHIA